MSQPHDRGDYVDIPATDVQAPDTHGKFSLNEDWAATVIGLVILGLCLLQVIPDIKGIFLS
jgi:hypothetical protein